MLVQVFVANPSKPQGVADILTNNRDKLLRYLEDFHTDKGGCQAQHDPSSCPPLAQRAHSHLVCLHMPCLGL